MGLSDIEQGSYDNRCMGSDNYDVVPGTGDSARKLISQLIEEFKEEFKKESVLGKKVSGCF